METLQSLQKRIITTVKLQSIVKSMKTLSAVSVKQYERAVVSLGDYLLNIESGLQVALRDYKLPVTKKKNGYGCPGFDSFWFGSGVVRQV